MTLPDTENQTMPQTPEMKPDKIARTFKQVLMRAVRDGRITSGVFECATALEMNPEQVMICVLPETTSDDITTSMQHKLIDAYCLENDIQTVKVTNTETLSHLLNSSVMVPEQTTMNEKPLTSPSMDCSCVLIGYPPKGKKNSQENRLMDGIWPHQVITLPS